MPADVRYEPDDPNHDMFQQQPLVQLQPKMPIPSVVTRADLLAMADLDGDPTNLTEEEAQMLEVLLQVLGGPPLGEIFSDFPDL